MPTLVEVQSKLKQRFGTQILVNGNRYQIDATGRTKVSSEDAAKLLQSDSWQKPGKKGEPVEAPPSSRMQLITGAGERIERDKDAPINKMKSKHEISKPISKPIESEPIAGQPAKSKAKKTAAKKPDPAPKAVDAKKSKTATKAKSTKADTKAAQPKTPAAPPAPPAPPTPAQEEPGLAFNEKSPERPVALYPELPAEGEDWPDPTPDMSMDYLLKMAEAYNVKTKKTWKKADVVEALNAAMFE